MSAVTLPSFPPASRIRAATPLLAIRSMAEGADQHADQVSALAIAAADQHGGVQ